MNDLGCQVAANTVAIRYPKLTGISQRQRTDLDTQTDRQRREPAINVERRDAAFGCRDRKPLPAFVERERADGACLRGKRHELAFSRRHLVGQDDSASERTAISSVRGRAATRSACSAVDVSPGGSVDHTATGPEPAATMGRERRRQPIDLHRRRAGALAQR